MGILRVILALCIYFVHTGWLGGFAVFPDRFRAVYTFFIISGFYMAFILNKKYVGEKNSYFLFIFNRFLRIYPLYWLILLLTIIFSAILLSTGVDTGDISGFIRAYNALYHENMILLPFIMVRDFFNHVTLIFHCGYFSRCEDFTRGLNTLSLAWTLNLELLFYLIAPFILRRKGIWRFGVILGIFLVWYIVFHFRLLSFYSTTYQFLHALKLFMLGFISYIIYEKIQSKKIPHKILVIICFITLLFIVLYAHIPLPTLRYKWLIFNDYIYYLGVTAAIPFLFRFSNVFRFDMFIAQLSYPLYISHIFTNEILEFTDLVKPHTQAFIIVGLIWALIFCSFITLFIENPIDKFRHGKKSINKLLVFFKHTKLLQVQKIRIVW